MVFDGDVRRAAVVLSARDEATEVYRQFRRETRAIQGEMVQAALASRNLIKALLGIGTAAVTASAAIGAVAVTQAEAGQRFQNVQTILGATEQELQILRDTAQSLSDDMAVSVNSVSMALEQLALSGFTVTESMQAIDEVTQLMAASTMDAEDAAEQLAEVFEEFSISGREADQVAGAFAATIDDSQTNVENLTNALTSAADVAERVGVSLQETSAAAGILANAGIQGEEAGEGLAEVFSSLQQPSEEAANTLNELGVRLTDIRDEQGNLRNLSTITSELQGGFQNVASESERARLAVQLVGEEGARALLPLINSQTDLNQQLGAIFRSEVRETIAGLSDLNEAAIITRNSLGELELSQDLSGDELAEQLRNLSEEGRSAEQITATLQTQLGLSQRTAEELAEDATDASISVERLGDAIGGAATASQLQQEQTSTLVGAVDNLVSSFSTLGNQIFEGLRDPLINVVQTIDEFVTGINQNEEALRRIGEALVPVALALITITTVLGGALANFLLIQPAIRIVNSLFTRFGTQLLNTGQTIRIIGASIRGLARFLFRLLLPVFVAIEVFTQLERLLASNFLGTGEAAREVVRDLEAAFEAIEPLLVATFEGFAIVLDIIVKLIALPIVGFVLALITVLEPLFDIIGLIVAGFNDLVTITQPVIDVLGFLIAAIITVVTLGGTLSTIFSLISGAVLSAVGALSALTGIFAALSGAISSIATFLGIMFSFAPQIASFFGLIASLAEPISTIILILIALGAAIVALIGYFGGLDNIVAMTKSAFNDFVGVLENIGAAIQQGINEAIQDAVVAFDNFVAASIEAFNNALGAAEQFIRDLPGILARGAAIAVVGFIRGLGALVGLIFQFGEDVIAAFQFAINDFPRIVRAEIQQIEAEIQAFIDRLVAQAAQLAINAGRALVGAFIFLQVQLPFLLARAAENAFNQFIIAANQFVDDAIVAFNQFIADVEQWAVSVRAAIEQAVADFIIFLDRLPENARRVFNNFLDAAERFFTVTLPRLIVLGIGATILAAQAAFQELVSVGELLVDIGASLIDAFIRGLVGAADFLVNIGGFLIDQFIIGIASTNQKLANEIRTLVDDVAEVFFNIPDIIAGVGGDIIDAIIAGLTPGPIIAPISEVVGIIDAFLPGSDADRGPLSNITEVGPAIVQTIADGILSAIGSIANVLTVLGTVTQNAILSLVGLVSGLGERLITRVVAGIQATLSLIQQAFGAIGGVLSDVIDTLLGIVPGVGRELLQTIIDDVGANLSVVRNTLALLPVTIQQVISDFIGTVTGAGGAIIDILVNGLESGVGLVRGAISNVVETIASFLPFSNADRGPLSNLMGSGSAIVDALVNGLSGGVGAVRSAIASIASAVKNGLDGMLDSVADVGKNIASTIANGLNAAKNLVGDAASMTVDAAVGAVKGGMNMAENAGQAVGGAVSDGVGGATNAVKNAGETVAGAIGGALPGSDADFGPLSNLTDVGPDFVQTLASGIIRNQSQVMNAATETMTALLGPLKNTPVGDTAEAIAGEAASGLQGIASAVGVDLPTGQSAPSTGGDGEGSVQQETGAEATQTGQGITININQTIEINSDGDTDVQDVASAAEQGTRNAVNSTLKELERLLAQEMNT